MSVIEFFMPMQPPTATAQLKLINWKNRTIYESQETANARAKLTAYLAAHRPREPLEGALSLLVKWCFQAAPRHRNGTWRTSRPDTDNLQKLLKDCMTALGFWKDDAQVTQEIIEKFWADTPGIFIRISSLTEPDP